MKICFVVSSLSSGGAERVISLVSSQMANMGHEVHLLLLTTDTALFYSLDPKVKLHRIDLTSSGPLYQRVKKQIAHLFTLRRFMKEINPDRVISFLFRTNVLVLISLLGTGFKTWISERNHPKHSEIHSYFWKLCRFLFYRMSECLVVQTRDIANCFRFHGCSIKIIPNPVINFNACKYYLPKPGTKNIACVARLAKHKGQKELIEKFGKIAHKFPDWQLLLYGEGPEKANLTNLILKMGLSQQVLLMGATKDLREALLNSEIFVLNSAFEGYPNALAEAMSLGLCCLSNDCPSGPSDLITDGLNGLLIPGMSVDEWTRTLEKVMQDKELRQDLGRQALHVAQPLGLENITLQWL